MSWFKVEVTDDKKDTFEKAFRLGFGGKWGPRDNNARPKTVTHMEISKDRQSLTLYSYDPGSGPATPLPYPMNEDGALDFARHWLTYAEYGDEPDTDGSTKKGWTILAEDIFAKVCTVSTTWIVYGK